MKDIWQLDSFPLIQTLSSSFNIQTSDFWHQLLGKVGISQMAGDGASITEC